MYVSEVSVFMVYRLLAVNSKTTQLFAMLFIHATLSVDKWEAEKQQQQQQENIVKRLLGGI